MEKKKEKEKKSDGNSSGLCFDLRENCTEFTDPRYLEDLSKSEDSSLTAQYEFMKKCFFKLFFGLINENACSSMFCTTFCTCQQVEGV